MSFRHYLSIFLYFIVLGCGTSAEYIHFRASSSFSDSRLLEHECMTILYSDNCKQAHWVAYTLYAEHLSGEAKRKDNFRPDPKVPHENSAQLSDYSGSGYDRGHLAPASDMRISQRCMDESFFLSNISPQLPAHNRGVWKRLEDKVREYTVKYDSVVVVTGPILNEELDVLGDNGVCIPSRYYKALLVNDNAQLKTIAFVVPNEGSSADLSTFVLTVDELEEKTGIDFFPYLPKATQKTIESETNYSDW